MKLKKLFLASTAMLSICLTSCAKSGVHHAEKDYFLDVDYTSDFKILQMSDIHLGMQDDLQLHYDFIDLTIKDADPNLIIITGDIFTFATTNTIDSFFSFMDSHHIPWGLTFGNHDEQLYCPMDYVTNALNNDYTYCKFINYEDDDVYGYANYCINLKDGSDTKYQIYMFDSNRYYYGDYMGYDYIHQDQIDWYERLVNYSTEQNGGVVVPSLSFFHIPLVEYKTAYELYKEGSSEVIYHYGENRENVSCAKYNSGLFNKMVELGSTKGIFVGHDHVNNSEIEYKGIDLVFGIHSTDRIYHDEDRMGGLVITIHDDASFSCDRYYHTYQEVK